MSGDLHTARDLMLQRMDMARKRGALSVVSYEASNLSAVERQLGNGTRAKELALEALAIEVRRSDEWAIPYTLDQLAAIAVEQVTSRRLQPCSAPPCVWSRSRVPNGPRMSYPYSRPAGVRPRRLLVPPISSKRGPVARVCRLMR